MLLLRSATLSCGDLGPHGASDISATLPSTALCSIPASTSENHHCHRHHFLTIVNAPLDQRAYCVPPRPGVTEARDCHGEPTLDRTKKAKAEQRSISSVLWQSSLFTMALGSQQYQERRGRGKRGKKKQLDNTSVSVHRGNWERATGHAGLVSRVTFKRTTRDCSSLASAL